MTTAYGALTEIAIAKETSFAQLPGSGWHRVLLSRFSLEGGHETAADDVFDGIDARMPIRDTRTARVSASVPVDVAALPLFWYGLLGDIASVDNGDGTWTHTITPTVDAPSWSVEQANAEASAWRRALGCKVESIRLSIQGSGLPAAEVDMVGAAHDVASAAAGSPTLLSGTRLANLSGRLTRGGTPEAVVLAADVSVSCALRPDFYVGGGGVAGDIIRSDRFEVRGALRARLQDRTHLDLVTNGTETTLVWRWEEDATHYVEVSLARVRFDIASVGIDGPGGLEAELQFVAAGGTSPSVTVTARNAVSAY